jgi:phosphatidylglycerol---prolipoprotein diacylglyceryl transferase
MHPVFLRLGPLTIHWYGMLVMMGFMAALWVGRRRAKSMGMNPDIMTDLCIVSIIAGIVGARIFFVIQNAEYFFDTTRENYSFFDIFKINTGGLVFYGGFILVAFAVMILCRVRKVRVLDMIDLATPCLALGMAFGRIGCLMTGCCYGIALKAGGWHTVVYPDSAPAYNKHALCPVDAGTPILASQLFASFGNLLIFTLLTLYFKRRKVRGEIAALFMILYGVHRFLIELLRGDTHKPGELSIAQIISIFIVSAGVALFVICRGKGGPIEPIPAKQEPEPQKPSIPNARRNRRKRRKNR